MDMILQKLQAFVKGLQEKYNSLSTPLKFLVGLALFTLLPCVAVCSTKWKGWVKALVCFFLFSFMLAILMYAFVFYLFWFIWKKTNWKTNVKVIVTTALIVVPIILGIVFGEPTPAEKTPSLPGASSSSLVSDDKTPSDETSSDETSSPLPNTADSSTQQSTSDINSTETQPPAEEREMTPYLQLAEDENAYLLFLRIIGTCYKDNTLTTEMFNEMAENSDVQMLVQDVLDYRYQNGTLSPDFVSSFSVFWNDNLSSTHQEVINALKISFDLGYDFIKDAWILKENEATVAARTESATADKEDFEWLPAVGHLYNGVDLYIVTEDTVTHYGRITALTSKEVEIYMIAAERAQWFGRRIPLITDVLKVRSDDPHLPQY